MGFFDKLFKPQWMSEIEYQAERALAEVDDPETLRRIMAEAPTGAARVAAMVKLGDQALFREIALTSEDWDLACEAALRVDDAAVLGSFLEREGLRDYLLTRDAQHHSLLKRLLSLTRASLDAVRADVPAMDDAECLVELAISDPEHDAPACPRSVKNSVPYIQLQGSAALLRKAATWRLGDLGNDDALAEVIRHAADDGIVELAVSLISDEGALDKLILDGGLRGDAYVCVIARINNADLLRKLAGRMDPVAARSSAAVRRLSELPCADGGYHEWVTISEEDNNALGLYTEGPHYIDWVKRCSKCGIELKGRS